MSRDGLALVLALVLTLAAGPPVLVALRRRRVLDVPNARSSHAVATPRGGGLAPALGATAALSVSTVVSGPGVGLLVAAAGFAVIGLWDDLRSTPPFRRLALQVSAALVALPWLLADLSGPVAWRVGFGVAVLVWLIGFVNAFNFMDGINGISACQAFVAGSAWYGFGLHQDEPVLWVGGAVIALAALGFAPFNLPTARMFLGDVGSYFFGGWLAALTVIGLRAGLPVEAVVAPVAVYLADTATTLVRRVRRGERWYEAHREHAYQRFTESGWSHMRTTALVGVAITGCSLLGAASLGGSGTLRLASDAVGSVVLVLYVTGPSLVARPKAMAA